MASPAPGPGSNSVSASSLPSSPVTSLPFIRRLFVTDPSSLSSSHPPSSFHPDYRRHSFDAGTIVWTDRRASASAASSSTSAFSPTACPPSSPSPTYSLSAASSPSFAACPLPPPPQLGGVDALDLSASTAGNRSPLNKGGASKLLQKLCRYEWDFS